MRSLEWVSLPLAPSALLSVIEEMERPDGVADVLVEVIVLSDFSDTRFELMVGSSVEGSG